MTSIAAWEQEFGKPVVTTNQASFWAMLRTFNTGDRIPTFWPITPRGSRRMTGSGQVVGEDDRRDEGPGLDEFGAVGLAAELLHRTQQAEPVQHLMLAAILDLVRRVAVPGGVNQPLSSAS